MRMSLCLIRDGGDKQCQWVEEGGNPQRPGLIAAKTADDADASGPLRRGSVLLLLGQTIQDAPHDFGSGCDRRRPGPGPITPCWPGASGLAKASNVTPPPAFKVCVCAVRNTTVRNMSQHAPANLSPWPAALSLHANAAPLHHASTVKNS
jgi:hypothetical protein